MKFPHWFHQWEYAKVEYDYTTANGPVTIRRRYRKCRTCGREQVYLIVWNSEGWEDVKASFTY